eukprot:8516023-Pyramimonas_sp.AAC.1
MLAVVTVGPVVLALCAQRRSKTNRRDKLDENVLRLLGLDDGDVLVETTIVSMLDIDQTVSQTRYFQRNELSWCP